VVKARGGGHRGPSQRPQQPLLGEAGPPPGTYIGPQTLGKEANRNGEALLELASGP
jgi:hypothetical protein